MNRTGDNGIEGARLPCRDNRVTEADYRPADTTVPTARVRSLII